MRKHNDTYFRQSSDGNEIELIPPKNDNRSTKKNINPSDTQVIAVETKKTSFYLFKIISILAISLSAIYSIIHFTATPTIKTINNIPDKLNSASNKLSKTEDTSLYSEDIDSTIIKADEIITDTDTTTDIDDYEIEENKNPELVNIIQEKNTFNENSQDNYTWALNLSSILDNKDKSDKILTQLRNSGINAEQRTVTIDNRVWHRIRITGFVSEQSAIEYMKIVTQKTDTRKYWVNKIKAK